MSEDTDIRAPWAPTKMDDAAEALIREVETEFDANAAEPDETSAGNNTVQQEAGAPVLDGEPGGTTGGVQVPVPGTKPEELSEAVRRELGYTAREEALRVKETRLEQLEAEIAALRGRQIPDDLTSALRNKTSETLTALGLDPDHVVRMVLAERLGDRAPEELRREITEATKESKADARIRILERRLEEQDQAARASAFIKGVETGARDYIQKPGISEHAPVVARVAKQNPERVYTEIMEEISRDANVKAARDPNAPLLTYEEAARRVETRWADLSKVLSPSTHVTPAPTGPASTSAPLKSPNTGSIKPPDRPLAPWLTRGSELEDEGIKAALAEYRRLETPGRTS